MENRLEIFTFKWGTKYAPEYVNRLYGSLLRHISVPFNFTCITDDATGLRKEIKVLDYKTFDPFPYPKDRIFTREKLVLLNHSMADHNMWIDLDVLIHGDITEYVTRDLEKPTFIFNHWFDLHKRTMFNFGRGASCHINSSFVCWTQDRGKWLYDYTMKEIDKIAFTYNSLDKYLFYRHWTKNNLGLWEDGIVYNYNYENPNHEMKDGYKIALFNTSHIRINGSVSDALELHEADGWAKELWESYDEE
jgi:hypothetical protein